MWMMFSACLVRVARARLGFGGAGIGLKYCWNIGKGLAFPHSHKFLVPRSINLSFNKDLALSRIRLWELVCTNPGLVAR